MIYLVKVIQFDSMFIHFDIMVDSDTGDYYLYLYINGKIVWWKKVLETA